MAGQLVLDRHLAPCLLPAAWIYDRDPFQPLKWQDDLEKFKARLAAGEDVFGPLIRKFLLDNGHRVTVELRPDSGLGDKIEETEQQRLQVGARPLALAGAPCLVHLHPACAVCVAKRANSKCSCPLHSTMSWH